MTCLMPLHKYQRKMDCRVGDKNKKNFHSKNLTGGVGGILKLKKWNLRTDIKNTARKFVFTAVWKIKGGCTI